MRTATLIRAAAVAAWVAAAATPALAIRTTPPVVRCTPPPSGSKEDRIKALWPKFEAALYYGGNAVTKQAQAKWAPIRDRWRVYAVAEPGTPARTSAEAAWRAEIAKDDSGITYLSDAQLSFFECYLPEPQDPSGMNASEVESAFRTLALGLNAADTSVSGRMDSLAGWFEWSAFAESYFATSPRASKDDAGWRLIQRGVLYGSLLHAHFDRLVCPGGTYCRRQPQFKPAGLNVTDEGSIRTYVYKSLDEGGVERALAELGRIVWKSPQLYPLHRMPPALQ